MHFRAYLTWFLKNQKLLLKLSRSSVFSWNSSTRSGSLVKLVLNTVSLLPCRILLNIISFKFIKISFINSWISAVVEYSRATFSVYTFVTCSFIISFYVLYVWFQLLYPPILNILFCLSIYILGDNSWF